MKRWLVAAILSAAALPSVALLLGGRYRAEEERDLARSALSDLVVDAPASATGTVADYGPLIDRLVSSPAVEAAGPVIVGPVLLESGERRAVGRLNALACDQGRVAGLGRIVVAGDLAPLREDDAAVALGEGLATALGARPGAEVTVLSLAPGPEALGARRRVLRVAAVLGSGLGGFDRDAAVARLAAARDLFAPGDRVSGVEVRLARPLPAEAARAALSPALEGQPLRVRAEGERDWPDEDSAALHGLGRGLLLTTLVAAALALALGVPFRKERGLGRYLREAGPIALLALAAAALAGLAASAASLSKAASPPASALLDVGRLVLALAVALFAAPALAGRLRGRAAAIALGGVVALATVAPSAATVLSTLASRTSVSAEAAVRSAARVLGPAQVDVMVQRGAEVVAARLVGADPRSAAPVKLLRVLTGRREVGASLRTAGPRPPAWSPDPALDGLLDELATHGSRVTGDGDVASPSPDAGSPASAPANAQGEARRAGIVLGRVLARRLGAEVGDSVVVAAAPAALDPESDVGPPWPRTFEVGGVASFGLRGVDDRLAVADSWQVQALGGRAAGGAPGPGLAGLHEPSDGAAPFAAQARRAAVAGALQVLLLALLLGAASARGSRGGAAGIALWAFVGLAVGIVAGGADAARGALGLGDPVLYAVVPRGSASPLDGVSIWSLVPAVVALAGAVAGRAAAARLGFGPVEPQGEAGGAP